MTRMSWFYADGTYGGEIRPIEEPPVEPPPVVELPGSVVGSWENWPSGVDEIGGNDAEVYGPWSEIEGSLAAGWGTTVGAKSRVVAGASIAPQPSYGGPASLVMYAQRRASHQKNVLAATATAPGAFSIEVQPNGELRAFIFDANMTLVFWQGLPMMAVGRAYRLALTVGDFSEATLWVDDTPYSTEITPEVTLKLDERPLSIGVWSDRRSEPFEGLVGPVFLANTILTADEIQGLPAAVSYDEPPVILDDLRGHWPLDDPGSPYRDSL